MEEQTGTALAVYPPEYAGLIRDANLSKEEIDIILNRFRTEVSLGDIEVEARAIVVTDAGQKDLVKQAHDLRMTLRTERVRIDKVRKETKEQAKREIDLIDGIGRILRGKFEAVEAHLQEQEDFAANQENERIKKLMAERAAKLAPYGVDGSFFDLRGMTDEQFDHLLQVHADAFALKVKEAERETAALAEAERIRNEELERLRKDNERLEQEKAAAESRRIGRINRISALGMVYNGAGYVYEDLNFSNYNINDESDEAFEEDFAIVAPEIARRKQIKAEADAAAEMIRLENIRIAKENADKAAADKAEADRLAAEAKAKELAPDGDKLFAYAMALTNVPRPELQTPEATATLDRFTVQFNNLLMDLGKDTHALTAEIVVPF